MILYRIQYVSAISYWDLYDNISDSICIRDILLGLYDTISDSIHIRDILLGLYDTISDSICIRDILFTEGELGFI